MLNARRSYKVEAPSQYEEEILQEVEYLSVRLNKNLVVKVIGDVTGNEYTFNGAGSIVNVDKRDVGIINKKNQVHKSCCGSYSSPYFDFV